MDEKRHDSRKLIQKGFAVSAIVCIGKVLGFLKQAVIAWAFGATAGTDIYFAADGFIAMFGQIQTASISPGVLTEYIHLQERGKKDQLDYLLRKCFVFFPLISILLIIIIVLFSNPLSALLGISYTTNQRSELQRYLILLSPVILFTSYSGISQGVLDANNRFVPSKLLSLFFSTSIIISVILFHRTMGIGSMLMGFLIGYGLHTLYVVILSKKYYSFGKIQRRDTSFKKVLQSVLPLVIGNSVVDLGHLVDKIVASSLTTGSVSYLNYGQVISNDIINAVIVTTIGTVLLPSLTREVAMKSEGAMIAKRVSNILSLMIALILMIVGVYIVETKDLVRLFFERGSFTPEATENVTGITLCYTSGFVFIAIREILAKTHYAFQDTVTPMRNGIIGVVVNSILSLILSRFIGVAGIALATSVSMALVAILMCCSIRKHIGVFPLDRVFFISASKAIVSAIAMVGVGILMTGLFRDSNYVLRMVVIMIVMMGTFAVGLLIMKHDAIRQIRELIRR